MSFQSIIESIGSLCTSVAFWVNSDNAGTWIPIGAGLVAAGLLGFAAIVAFDTFVHKK